MISAATKPMPTPPPPCWRACSIAWPPISTCSPSLLKLWTLETLDLGDDVLGGVDRHAGDVVVQRHRREGDPAVLGDLGLVAGVER
jgi:hypothetical protein